MPVTCSASLPLLRPEFTRALAATLTRGESLNMIGPHGQGRRRTLADLRLLLGDDIRILQGNLRRYPGSAAQLLADLCRQAGCAGHDFLSLAALLDRDECRWLIILHNFDELQPGSEGGFDAMFFESLQMMAGRANAALLCVSEKEVRELLPFVPTIALPTLSREQIQADIRRRNPAINEHESLEMSLQIMNSNAPYSELDEQFPLHGD